MSKVEGFWQKREPTLESMLLKEGAAAIDAIERPEVLSYLPPLKNFHVLDFGAGIGRFTTEFAKKAAHVTALDLVPQFIAENKRRNHRCSNITYICDKAQTIEFPPASFDLVFASGIFMYLDDPELAAASIKIHTWIKPGGYLFFRDSCSAQAKTTPIDFANLRTLHYYHQLMDPLFQHIHSGSIQAYIDLFANPFRCYWLYQRI
jgi:phosphoethanolamine N-methyltransferase